MLAEDCGEARDAAALPDKLRATLAPPAASAPASAAPAAAPGGGPGGRAAPGGRPGSGGGGGGGASEEWMLLEELPLGLAGGEVDVRPVWGLDPFTRRWGGVGWGGERREACRRVAWECSVLAVSVPCMVSGACSGDLDASHG